MEYYNSTCSQCGHTWYWVGFKTTMGKTPEQIEAMKRAGKECPRCKGPAKVELDFTSPQARASDGALQGLAAMIAAMIVKK